MLLKEAKEILKKNGYRVLQESNKPWEDDEQWKEIKDKRTSKWLTDEDKEYLCSIPLFDKFKNEILDFMKKSDNYDLDSLNPKYNEKQRLQDGIIQEWLKNNGARPFTYSYWGSLRDDFSRKIHADQVWYYVKKAEKDEREIEAAKKYREQEARLKELRQKEYEEKERLRKEDPDAYWDKYVRNTVDDPGWRGPNGNWSLD